MREWLPEDDLVFVVLDAVATLDLVGFYGSYRADGPRLFGPAGVIHPPAGRGDLL